MMLTGIVDLHCEHQYKPTVNHDLDVGFDLYVPQRWVVQSVYHAFARSQDRAIFGSYADFAQYGTASRYVGAGRSVEDMLANLGIENIGTTIRTGVSINATEKGYWIKLFDKSGVFAKKNILVGGGVIDTGYIGGDISVPVINFNPFDVVIEAGSKICQAVIMQAHYPSELISIDGQPIMVQNPAKERGADGGLHRENY